MAKYYVDALLGEDSNAGTAPDEAWASIDAVNDAALSPGDIVCFKRGQTHTGQLNADNNGSSSNPITYTAYGSTNYGQYPILSNIDFDSSGQPSAIDINASWVIIENLAIDGCRYAGIQNFENKNDNIIRYNHFLGNGTGIRMKGSRAQIYKNLFASSIMTDDDNTSNDNGAVGVVIEGTDSSGADDPIIRDNVFKNCVARSQQFGVDGGAIEFFRKSAGARIYRNTFIDCKGVMEMGGKYLSEEISDVDFYNNTIINCKGRWLFLNNRTGGFPVEISDIHFFSNTVVETEVNRTLLFFDGTWSSISSKFTLTNNVVHCLNTVTNQSGITHTNNNFYRVGGGSLGVTLGGTESSASPAFVDIDAYNLKLSASSPALGLGTTISGYTEDANGNVLQSPPDAGAYQSLTTTKNSGIRIAETMVPYANTSTDTFAIAGTEHLQGTFKSLTNMHQMLNMPDALRTKGMLVYTQDTSQHFWLGDDLDTWYEMPNQPLKKHGEGGILMLGHIVPYSASGTNGGGSGTADAVNVRPFNTILVNTIPGAYVNLSSNRFKLGPGVYNFEVSMTFSKTDEVQAWVEDITTDKVLAYGLNGWSATSSEQNTQYQISGVAQIEDDVDIEIKAYYEKNNSGDSVYTYGRELKKSGKVDNEVYLLAKITRIS